MLKTVIWFNSCRFYLLSRYFNYNRFEFLSIPQSIQIGGTSLLEFIGVAIETMKSLEAQVYLKGCQGFGGR
ncbi:hypothetical protein ACVXZZ_03535 [Staphylococcus aureus]